MHKSCKYTIVCVKRLSPIIVFTSAACWILSAGTGRPKYRTFSVALFFFTIRIDNVYSYICTRGAVLHYLTYHLSSSRRLWPILFRPMLFCRYRRHCLFLTSRIHSQRLWPMHFCRCRRRPHCARVPPAPCRDRWPGQHSRPSVRHLTRRGPDQEAVQCWVCWPLYQFSSSSVGRAVACAGHVYAVRRVAKLWGWHNTCISSHVLAHDTYISSFYFLH